MILTRELGVPVVGQGSLSTPLPGWQLSRQKHDRSTTSDCIWYSRAVELFLKVQQGLPCYTTNLARQDFLRGKRKTKILRVIRHNKKFSEGLDIKWKSANEWTMKSLTKWLLPFAGTVDVVSWIMMSVKQELTSFWSFLRHWDRQCKWSFFFWLFSVKTCRNSTKLPLLPVNTPLTAILYSALVPRL